MRWTVYLVIFSMFVLQSTAGQAQMRISDAELQLLPKYCAFANKMASAPPEMTRQFQTQSQGCNSVHHYCWALVAMNRATLGRASDEKRTHYFGTAVDDINYTLGRSEASCLLLPEMLTKKGVALTFLKKFPDAEANFREAISAKSDYWPAYKGLAEMYMASKRHDLAREVLKEGIDRVSDQRALRQLLSELNTPGKVKPSR